MTRSGLATITAAIVLCSTAVVFADPITITVDHRRVGALVGYSFTGAQANDTLVATATPPRGSGAATAALASSFSNPMHWLGAGLASVSPTELAFYLGSSTFE